MKKIKFFLFIVILATICLSCKKEASIEEPKLTLSLSQDNPEGNCFLPGDTSKLVLSIDFTPNFSGEITGLLSHIYQDTDLVCTNYKNLSKIKISIEAIQLMELQPDGTIIGQDINPHFKFEGGKSYSIKYTVNIAHDAVYGTTFQLGILEMYTNNLRGKAIYVALPIDTLPQGNIMRIARKI